MCLPVNGMFQTISTGSSSEGGGLLSPGGRRTSQTYPRFVNEEEIVPVLEGLHSRVEMLEDALDDDRYLYIEPLTAREEYEREIRECRDWRKESPMFWKMMFKKNIDLDTFAFTLLSEDTRKQLIN